VSTATVLSTDDVAHPRRFSAGRTFIAVYKLLFAKAGAIFEAIWLPTALAAAVAIVVLKAYFTLLSIYLWSADIRVASLTASLFIVGFLVWLLLNVMATVRIARVVYNKPLPALFEYQDMAPEARLYAGALRYLLVLTVVGSVTVTAVAACQSWLPLAEQTGARLVGWALFAIFALVFSIRCGFLGAPLALFERQRILRRGWAMTKRHVWQIAVLWAVLLVLPGVALQALGDFLMRPWMDGIPGGALASLAAAASWLGHNDAGLVAIGLSVTVTTTLCLVLTTVGSCLVYSSLRDA
jgi:hypothetical protein